MAAASLDTVIADQQTRYPGTGGAIALLRNGEVLARHAWGWADIAKRVPFTPQTPSLICSITKQFTCGLLLDRVGDPDLLDGAVRAHLPALHGAAPRARELCHNQSGLRDYWALTALCGAPVERAFGEAEAQSLMRRARTLHFAPGTRYSYANQNFRILSDILEQRCGENFGALLRRHVFDPAGMPHAMLNADTESVAGGTIGYEGSAEQGFRAAVNRIHWRGDAGIAASLDDMIAWERRIDATRDDPDALYSRLAAPVAFRDGTLAQYGFGLGRPTLLGRRATAHAGGLRGWRSFRARLPAERISVVVLFNHMADPRAAALDLLAAVLDAPPPPKAANPGDGWAGRYIEPETGLAIRIEALPERLRLRYTSEAEMLSMVSPGEAASGTTRLTRDGLAVTMHRAGDNQTTRLQPCADGSPPDIEGVYRCEELGATLVCTRAGGVLYAACAGDLGEGEMQALIPHGADHWLMPCPRALDYSPPGDWTLATRRDTEGRVTGLTIGCWLARNLEYGRIA